MDVARTDVRKAGNHFSKVLCVATVNSKYRAVHSEYTRALTFENVYQRPCTKSCTVSYGLTPRPRGSASCIAKIASSMASHTPSSKTRLVLPRA